MKIKRNVVVVAMLKISKAAVVYVQVNVSPNIQELINNLCEHNFSS
jgi:hypothetical protein